MNGVLYLLPFNDCSFYGLYRRGTTIKITAIVELKSYVYDTTNHVSYVPSGHSSMPMT